MKRKNRIILNKRAFERKVEKGEVEIRPYLKIRWYPSLAKENYRYVGIDDNSIDGQYRVMQTKRNMLSFQNYCYLGEVFIRFASLVGYSAMWGNKQYKILHYPFGSKSAQDKELAGYWSPGSRVGGLIQRVFQRASVIPENFHEFVFHIFRRPIDGEYEFTPYYRDESLSVSDHFDGKNIVKYQSDRPQEIKINTDKHRRQCSLWRRDDIMSTVQFIKGVLIPLEEKRPTKSVYISWFMEYAGVDKRKAEIMYNHRSEVRLV